MKLLRILVVLGILAVFGLFAVPCYATADPSLEQMDVYRNLLETGDYLYFWMANIPYATLPDTAVNLTFIWRLIDTDGTTVLGTTTGYPYNDDGYGYNVYSMYFSAADATALGMVWGTAYTLRLTGNPAVFVTPPTYNFSVAASDYTSLTDSDDNQAALAAKILNTASTLNVSWALATDYFLTTEVETGTVLSIFGEDVFRGSIYGCQALAPAAFAAVVRDISAVDRSWNSTYSTALEDQWTGTWIETAKAAQETFLGTSYDLMSIILVLAACIALIFANLSVTNDIWGGLLDVTFILIATARLGAYNLTYLGLIAAICIIYIGTRIWRNLIPS